MLRDPRGGENGILHWIRLAFVRNYPGTLIVNVRRVVEMEPYDQNTGRTWEYTLV